MKYIEEVLSRSVYFSVIVMASILIDLVKSMYAMLVIFLDRGNSLRDGVQVRANHKFGFRDSTYNGLISISNVRIMMIGKRNNGFQWCNGVPHGIDRTSHKTDCDFTGFRNLEILRLLGFIKPQSSGSVEQYKQVYI